MQRRRHRRLCLRPATPAGSGDGAVLGTVNTTWRPSEQRCRSGRVFQGGLCGAVAPGEFREAAVAPIGGCLCRGCAVVPLGWARSGGAGTVAGPACRLLRFEYNENN